MGVKLPNGSTVFIATALAAAKKITAASNAAEAVMTCSAHGLAQGDYVVLSSGWGGGNGRVFRVGEATTDTFKLVGFDTTNTEKYPAGAGVGSFRKVTGWQQITQITEVSTSGGEQQMVDYGFLEEDFDRQMPTTRSAGSITFTIADDPELPGFKAAAKASDAGAETPMRLNLKGGAVILYNGYPSLNKIPTLNRNQIMTVTLTYSMSGEPTRY